MPRLFIRGWIHLSIAGLASLFAPAGGASEPNPKAPICSGCNVVLVMVDTLRADHLGLYGYERDTSPNIDRFAETAISFDSARSQAACTWPSVISLLTSRHPFNFPGGSANKLIPPEIASLPELLKENGYRTLAVSGSPIVRKTPSRFIKHGEFGRGFDSFEECECKESDCTWKYKPHARCINQKADVQLSRHAGGEKPFFLYLHYMDVHGHYDPPGRNSRRFGSPYRGQKAWIAAGDANPIEKMIYKNGPDIGLTGADLQHLVDLYDDEIYYFDSQFRRILRALERGGVSDNTIVIISSDHGEEFMEHGSIKHCRTLFDTEIRTPLIVRIPLDIPRGRRNALVENLDVVPTLVDYLGLDTGGRSFDGVSLRRAIEANESVRSHSFSSQNTLRSVTNGRHKLIYDLANDTRRLYDLQTDPHERIDIESEARPTSEALNRELRRWLNEVEGNESGFDAERAKEMSRETEERLKEIGYLQ